MTRHEVDISRDWEWIEGRVSRAWLRGRDPACHQRVDLPHCWNQTDTFQPGVTYRVGEGGYRTTIQVPDRPDLHWFLESEGFYGLGELWIDGRRVAPFDGEFLGLAIDITGHVHPGREHQIAIRLRNRCPLHVLPGIRMPDFLLHGGLAGRCFLRGKPASRIVDDSIVVAASPGAPLEIRFACTQGAGDARCIIRDAKGAVVGEASGRDTLRLPGLDLEPWEVLRPVLYTVDLSLDHGDARSIRFGVRDAEFRGEDGFFLNGRRVPLHGCNRHEAIPGVGNALTPVQHRHDAALLKAFGCNFVRLSHYPQHPAFLDACDEQGILVYAEIATWKSVRGGRWLRNACRQMSRMIRRDRNHPSVILWGLGNESRKRKPYLELTRIVRDLDPGRATIYAENHIYRARRERTLDIPDVFGVNYEMKLLDEARAVSRTGAVLVSECASWPTPRGDRDAELGQLQHIQKAWDLIGERPFVAGFTLWCFADYPTLRKQRYSRYSGIVDAWRMPKPAAWLMKAAHHPDPFVKVIADWGRAGPPGDRRVLVFTNCPSVRVSGGGVLSGKRWYALELPFTDAPLTAACSEDPGISDTVQPWSAATTLLLSRGPGFIDIQAVDDDGVRDEEYSGPVTIRSEPDGQVLIYRPGTTIDLVAGAGRVCLRDSDGPVTVHVTGPELVAATCHCPRPDPGFGSGG